MLDSDIMGYVVRISKKEKKKKVGTTKGGYGSAGLPWSARPTRDLADPCVDNDLRLLPIHHRPVPFALSVTAQPRSKPEMCITSPSDLLPSVISRLDIFRQTHKTFSLV